MALDTAKNARQDHRVDERGRVKLRKRLRREPLTDFFRMCRRASRNGQPPGALPYRAQVLTTICMPASGHRAFLRSHRRTTPMMRQRFTKPTVDHTCGSFQPRRWRSSIFRRCAGSGAGASGCPTQLSNQIGGLYEELWMLSDRIASMDKRLDQVYRQSALPANFSL
jgi:hypothetical protein